MSHDSICPFTLHDLRRPTNVPLGRFTHRDGAVLFAEALRIPAEDRLIEIDGDVVGAFLVSGHPDVRPFVDALEQLRAEREMAASAASILKDEPLVFTSLEETPALQSSQAEVAA